MHISFELFPPKTSENLEKLVSLTNTLQETWQPTFFSVTCGAGSSTNTSLSNTLQQLIDNQMHCCPHLTSGNHSIPELQTILENYSNQNIQHLLALSGDTQKENAIHANDLIKLAKSEYPDAFQIGVGAYPEIHPKSTSIESEMHYFKQKVDAGADFAITQYFYNTESYLFFLELCDKWNITIPIIPGIMPITNYERLLHFSNICGAEIPRWLDQHLSPYQQDSDFIKRTTHIVTEVCQRLLEIGAPGFHFYTMNRLEPTNQILHNLFPNANT